MAALSGEKTLAELSAEFGVHPTMISNWKQELVKRAGELFARGSKAPAVEGCAEGDRRTAPEDRAAAGRVRFSCRAARHLPSAETRLEHLVSPNS
jgi:transposase-like protein